MRFSPLLVFNICAGIVGLLTGAVAMTFRKGSRGHRVAGNVFFVSMLSLGAAGAYLAARKSQMSNVFGGVLTFYLVATGWVTIRRRDGERGVFELLAALFALAVGSGMWVLGLEAARSPTGSKAGVPAGMYFLLGSVALLGSAGDVRLFLRGGLTGVSRISRHLWRMCFALFIAAVSVFLGQQQVFPEVLRTSHVLLILSILPLVLMIFWLIRVRFEKTYTRKHIPTAAEAYPVRG